MRQTIRVDKCRVEKYFKIFHLIFKSKITDPSTRSNDFTGRSTWPDYHIVYLKVLRKIQISTISSYYFHILSKR